MPRGAAETRPAESTGEDEPAAEPASAQPGQQPAASADEGEKLCWICYGSTSPMISPCDCRGSMQWVHTKCLHTWVTTRVVSAATDSNRFDCPNCSAAYVLERAPSSSENEDLGDIWPDWWPWPKHFGTLDQELVSSFRWRLIQPLLCVCVHVLLLLVSGWYIKEFWRDVGENGLGELLSLIDITARQLQDQPILKLILTSTFGEEIVANPVRVDIELGHISKVRTCPSCSGGSFAPTFRNVLQYNQ